jgi:hypothetical protein
VLPFLPANYTGGLGEGGYREINLRSPPFKLPAPVWQTADGNEGWKLDFRKHIALWKLDEAFVRDVNRIRTLYVVWVTSFVSCLRDVATDFVCPCPCRVV